MSLLRATLLVCGAACVAQPAARAQAVQGSLADHLHWYLPPSPPRAGILAVPGCSGVSFQAAADRGAGSPTDSLFRRHYPRMAAELADSGYAVALLDYLSLEGLVGSCAGELTPARIGIHVAAALGPLRQRLPSPAPIFIIGWSLGGAGVLSALQSAGVATAVAGIVLLYPGCAGQAPGSIAVPLRLYLGEDDDITPAQRCTAYAASHPTIVVHRYPRALHGFDIRAAPVRVPTGRGTVVGFQREAADAAWRDIHAFLATAGRGRPH